MSCDSTISSQQITPVGAIIAISHGICRRSQCTGGIGILVPGQDIPGVIVSPCIGLIQRRVILPDELILAIVGIAGGIRPITDCQDIAVAVIGISQAIIGRNLSGGSRIRAGINGSTT